MYHALPDGWKPLLHDTCENEYFARLSRFVQKAYGSGAVYPPKERLFSAFALTAPENVKVVILGQDPYHEPGQAQGLAFYVPDTVRTPPSLRNITKELVLEYPENVYPGRPDLLGWAKQGVLLLNATLTVAAGKAGSHQKKGWETFTDAVIQRLSQTREHLVFLLWGAYAQSKSPLIDPARHCVLCAPHPSPLSARRGFFGCNHFRSANAYLVRHGMAPIDW